MAMEPLIENVRPAVDFIRTQNSAVSSLPWIDLENATSCEIVFWPSFGTWGQPDVLLVFRDRDQHVVHLVVVEAKLFSSKSGEAGNDAEDELGTDDSHWHPDQLVRYWRGLLLHAEYPASTPRSLIYLTAHPAPPLDDLEKSLAACPSMRLGWISWRHIWDAVASHTCDPNPAPAAIDLERLLAHRGFRSLNAFTMQPFNVAADGHFWTPKPWFTGLPSLSLGDGSAFWRVT